MNSEDTESSLLILRIVSASRPATLSARIRRENGVDVWTQVTGTMAGPGGEFSYSSITSMRLYDRQEVTFQGETGMIRVVAPFNAGVYREAQVHVVHENTTRVHHFPDVRQYVLEMQAFARSVREGVPFAWTLEDARGTQAMIDLVLANEV